MESTISYFSCCQCVPDNRNHHPLHSEHDTCSIQADCTETAERQFDLISLAARERTIGLLQPAMQLALMATHIPEVDVPVTGSSLDHPARRVFTSLLSDQPAFYSAYLGLKEGFEVMKSTIADQTKKLEETLMKLAQREARLLDDFTFIAECNEGSEFMSDEALDRLNSIAPPLATVFCLASGPALE